MRSLLSNFSWGSLGNIASTILRALTLVILARFTVPAEFAVYASVFGILAVGKAVADLGLTKLITKDRALEGSSQLYVDALKVNGYSSFILGAAGVIGILGAWVSGALATLQLLPLALSTAFEKNADSWRSIHVADGKTRIRAADLMARRMASLCLFTLLVFTETLAPIIALALSEMVAAFASLIAARWHLHRDISLPSRLRLRSVLVAARPFWINSIAMSTRNLDVAVVSGVAPLTQSGYFAAAARLVGPLQVLPSSLAMVLLPHVARSGASARIAAGRLPALVALLSFPVCVLLSAGASPLVPYILGDAYSAGILCIQIIILGTPLPIYFNLSISVLQGQGFERIASRVSLMFAGLLIPSVAVGAYLGGATGAALGTVSANLSCVLLVYIARRQV